MNRRVFVAWVLVAVVIGVYLRPYTKPEELSHLAAGSAVLSAILVGGVAYLVAAVKRRLH